MSDDERLGRVMVTGMAIGHVGCDCSSEKRVKGRQGQRGRPMEWSPA